VIYDANVLVGNAQRDLLVRIALTGLVQAKWTDRILDEAFAAVQKSRPVRTHLKRSRMSSGSWSGPGS
jgi:hypothetical protein